MNELAAYLAQWRRPRILVIGDIMLDRYTWGEVDRISPEAPVPVVRAISEEVRLGGAASVAGLLRALKAQVELVGVTGDDASARTVQRLLAEQAIPSDQLLLDAGRPTTEKWRLLGRSERKQPHHIARVDHEEVRDINNVQEELLRDRVFRLLPECQAVLVSDYAKGLITPGLLRPIIDRANRHDIPVLVDPGRGKDLRLYRHADCLLPNRDEAAWLSGREIACPRAALQVARAFCAEYSLGAVLLKLDRDGMVLADQRHLLERALPALPCQVQDVTGAGDMVLAALGLSLASGLTLLQGAQLANVAASLEVQQLGVAPVSRSSILAALTLTTSPAKVHSLEELVALADGYRQTGKRIVLTNGCFDLLHVGHVTYLQEAARLGDVLIVAINSDESVRQLKGPTRPIIRQDNRAAMLAALECVTHVLVFDEPTPHRLLEAIRPDVLVKGGTYARAEVVGHEVVDAYGGDVQVLCLVEGVSTSSIVSAIQSDRTSHAEIPSSANLK
jgi:D-beta-D-heptose 7-phosphate kinase/D-beta-D-heptose 1-phosphate adenosyltransferase